MKRRISFRNEPLEDPIINITPLIDVVFVVLIIFILIAPMLELDRIELASGAPMPNKQTTAPESTPLAIHVHPDNSIWFNGRSVTEEQLISLLKNAHTRNGTRIPQLFQDKKASFGSYQTVKNAVEVAGFEQLDVILKPG